MRRFKLFVEREEDPWWLFYDSLRGIGEKRLPGKVLLEVFFSGGIYLFDVLLVFLAFLASYFLVREFFPWEFAIFPEYTLEFGYHARTLWFMLPASPFVLIFCQVYGSYRYRSLGYMLGRLLFASIALTFLSWSFRYLIQGVYMARILVFSFPIVCFLLLSLSRFLLVKLLLENIHKKGIGVRAAIIVGTNALALRCLKDIRRHPFWGIKVMGLLSSDPALVGKKVEGVDVLGSIEGIEDLTRGRNFTELLIPLSKDEDGLPRFKESFLDGLVKEGKMIRLISERNEKPLSGSRMRIMRENVTIFYTSDFKRFSLYARFKYRVHEWVGFHPWITQSNGRFWKASNPSLKVDRDLTDSSSKPFSVRN